MIKNSLTALVLVATTLITPSASAIDDGPRMYWNAPVDMNIMQTYAWSMHGNQTTPLGGNFDPDVSANMNLVVMGYNRIIDLFSHSTIITAMITAGNISGEYLGASSSTRGYGDLYVQGTFNLIGAPALSAKEFAMYEQGTVLSLIMGLSMPTGEYDNKSALNMGTNQWAGKIALPFMQTIGAWKPGSITTFEVTPSVWFYGNNSDYGVTSDTLKKDPLYSLEAHLTQDITPTFFVSFDYMYQNGAQGEVNGVKSEGVKSDTAGLTFAYMLNEQLQFQFRYASSLNPTKNELSADITELNFNYFW
jgi:hypothetical protein